LVDLIRSLKLQLEQAKRQLLINQVETRIQKKNNRNNSELKTRIREIIEEELDKYKSDLFD